MLVSHVVTAQALFCGDRLACIPTAIRRLLLALTVSWALE